MHAEIIDRIKTILHKIEVQEIMWGRQPASVKLVIVSKNVNSDLLDAAIATGCRSFAESRVVEAKKKWFDIKANQKSPDIELRFIGRLQRNKIQDAIALFDVIETVTSDAIAAAIVEAISNTNKSVRAYVQVNTGLEINKNGVDPRETVQFVDRCRRVHGLEISGLMCIPPKSSNPGPHFALLHKLAREAEVFELSMGMSDDFETAIAMGATHVRLGRAIFGFLDSTLPR